MSDKIFINSNYYMNLSISLAEKIENSDYKPDMIIGVSRGGCFPAITIHEYLNYKGINCEYNVISAKSYENNVRQNNVFIDISKHTEDCLNRCNRILIIDDVFDSGYTIMNICNYLYNMKLSSDKFKIATVYYKPNCNKTTIVPDFYIEETDKWIVFPHELLGLNNNDIKYKNILI